MLSMFNAIMRQESKFPEQNRVKVQVIQTISILVQNVKTDTSLFYLMSNNHINDLLCMDLEFVAESDLLAHYVSFLKLISLMLTPATIQFFFNENAEDDSIDFPLYTEALRFFDHSENMVRTCWSSTATTKHSRESTGRINTFKHRYASRLVP